MFAPTALIRLPSLLKPRQFLIVLIPLVTILSSSPVLAQTSVSGTISSDETWTAASSPYILTGDILVASGGKLTIDAGVEVDLNGYFIHVDGTLRAEGTASSKVSFTGTASTGGEGNFIAFKSSSIDYDSDTDTGSLINHATFYVNPSGGAGISGYSTNGAIHPLFTGTGGPKISNSTITSLSGSAIVLRSSGAIISNNILRAPGTVIDGQGNNGATIINNVLYGGSTGFRCIAPPVAFEYNTLIGNGSGTGITFHGAGSCLGSGTFKYNLIYGYSTAIGGPSNYSASLTLHYNSFINNTPNNLTVGEGTGQVDATNNWWGVATSGGIEATIVHNADDFRLSTVNFDPFLTAPNTAAPISPPQNIAAQTGPTTISLAWDANPESDIAGYKVHYDTDAAGYPYANSVDVGNVTSYTLTGLTTGTTYYTAVSAYDADGNESWVSTDVSATTQSVPTALAFTTQPAGPSAGTFGTQPVVTIQDGAGNVVTDSSATVTLTLSSGTLIGTTTLNAINGIATFTDLGINTADDGYVLTATSSGLTSATSDAFNLAVGTATQLVYTTQPADSTSGELLSTQPVVTIQDGAGNVVTDSSATVTLTLSSGTLIGTTTLNAINGIATFTDISVSTAGAGLTLTASSIGLTSATSSSFAVLAGNASAISVVTQPGNATSGTAFATQPVVHIVDAQGNLIASSSAPVTASITSGTGATGATLSGSTTVTATGGVATFTDLRIDEVGMGYTLMLSSGGLSSAVSSSLDVIVPATPTPIPAMSVWGLIATALLVSAWMAHMARRGKFRIGIR